jgi:hypothetical protein
VRSAADLALQQVGCTLVGSGGWRRLDTYSIQRLSLPVPVISRFAQPVEVEVDLDKVTTPCGFSYHRDGWHPYRETLRELIERPDLPYGETTLCRFYEGFQPQSVQEVLLEEVEEPLEPIATWPPLLYLFKHVWELTPRHVAAILRAPEEHKGGRQQFGPQPPAFGQTQVERLWRVYESVRRVGYRPGRYPDDYLTGYFLVRGDDYRFMVFNGNHRLAAFKELGIERVRARPHRGHPPVVDADRLDRWSEGRYGVLPADVCRQLFDKSFDELGRAKAQRLGLT